MAKREEYINWDEFFMFTAAVAAQRSKDPSTQVGAVIVDDTKIISVGYNGMSIGISDDAGLWGKDNEDETKNKYMWVCHAEMNAITMSNRSCDGCKIYVTHFPCHECAKMIAQSGIKEIVYVNEWGMGKSTHGVSGQLLNAANVKITEYDGRETLTLNL